MHFLSHRGGVLGEGPTSCEACTYQTCRRYPPRPHAQSPTELQLSKAQGSTTVQVVSSQPRFYIESPPEQSGTYMGAFSPPRTAAAGLMPFVSRAPPPTCEKGNAGRNVAGIVSPRCHIRFRTRGGGLLGEGRCRSRLCQDFSTKDD